MVTDTVTIPWTSAATATQAQPSPLPALTAYMTGTAETQTFTALASGGYRESDDTYTHDSYGRVTSGESRRRPTPPTPPRTPAPPRPTPPIPRAWLMDLPAEVTVRLGAVQCHDPVPLPGRRWSRTR